MPRSRPPSSATSARCARATAATATKPGLSSRRRCGRLAKPQPDETVVEQILDEGLARRRTLQHEHTRSMRAFLETLAPEQRERFVGFMGRRMERRERSGRAAAPAR